MSKIIVNNLEPDTGISTVTVNGNVEATKFVGPVEGNISGGTVAGSTGTFSSNVTIDGNLGVAGTITYEDVARVDATGISTFREGLNIGPLAGIAATYYNDGSIRSTGIITATSFSGSLAASNLTGALPAISGANLTSLPAQATIANNADNRVITGGSGVNLNGESNLTFNGSLLNVSGKIACDVNSDISMSSSADGQLVIGGNGYTSAISLDGTAMNIYHNSSSRGIIFGINETEKIRITSGGDLKLPDSAKIELGGAQTGAGDLKIYHATNQSIIQDTYGDLRICGDTIRFRNGGNSFTAMQIQGNAATTLYYSADSKLSTSTTGITVSGEVAASQDYPNYRPRVDWNFAAVKKLDPRIKYRRRNNASYTDEFGIIRQVGENEPRFDHDPITGECKGLLLEDGRTNLVASSEDMNENFGSWVNNGLSARYTDTSGVISPDGTTGSTKLIENSATSSHLVYDNVSASASTGYITSVFLKKPATNGRTFGLITEGNTQNSTAYFNLVDGTVTNNGGSGYVSAGTIEYPNGWWRCWMRFNSGGSQSSLNVQFGPAGDSGTGTFSYAGDSSKYILAWGAQCESGEMITSYIKTERHANDNGSARGQDFTTVEGSDFSDIFDTDFKQFSMVADYDNTTTPDGNSYSIIDLWGEATGYDDRIEWFKDNASPYHIETRSVGQGNATFVNGALSASSKAKSQRFATSWYVPDYSNTSSRRFVVSMGGEAVDVIGDSSGTTVPQLTRLGIGCNPTRLDFSAGVLHFKRLMFYNRTLSDGQLQNLSAQ